MQKKMNFMMTKNTLSTFLILPLSLVAFSCGSSGGSGTYNPRNPLGLGPAPVSLAANGAATVTSGDLGSAGNYAILSKSGISNVTGGMVTGNIGVSPAAASYITGFPQTTDVSGVYSTSAYVTQKIYAANYNAPTAANLTSAIGNMQTAYTDAAGRTNPDFTELATGNLGGLTLTPGLYKWSTSVSIPLNVTISGSATDVWIFQIAGDLTMAAAKSVVLGGSAQAKNIFWQVAGQVTIGTTSQFYGIILSKTAITLQNLARLDGRAYAQTAVALDNNAVTQP
ncbi:MAG: DUF3494 domain-containing protein [Bdellovibrionaceae bacterium]|nr:DUF3494 domain-containing protein [Bdellovibrio sp.]